MIRPPIAQAWRPVAEICRFRLSDGDPSWSTTESRRVIRCAFRRFAPAQLDHALYIAERESNYVAVARNPWVASACRWENPFGSCGLFQHLMRYWGQPVLAYGRAAWFPAMWPRVNSLNARANALIMVRMVAVGGWGFWGG